MSSEKLLVVGMDIFELCIQHPFKMANALYSALSSKGIRSNPIFNLCATEKTYNW